MRRVALVIDAMLASTLFMLAAASPVSAECNPSGADTSFVRTAPYATRIVIGRVVDAAPDPDGQGPAQGGETFTLDVERVLRGPAVTEVQIDFLETGGCIRWLSASDGDRIVLAFETRGDRPGLAMATAAWLDGQPRGIDPYQVLTMTEVLDAVAAPRPPDTATAPTAGQPSWVGAGILAATFLASFVLVVVAGRRRVGRI